MIDLAGLAIGGGTFALAMLAVLRWEPLAVAVAVIALLDSYVGFDIGYRTDTFTIQPADIASAVALMGVSIRMVMFGRFTRPQLAWLAFTVISGIAFARGAAIFGVMAAGNSYRQMFYLSVATCYFLSFDFGARELRRVAALWLTTGTLLGCYVVLAWIDPGMRPEGALDVERLQWATAMDGMRATGANGGLLLAQCVVLTMSGWIPRDFAPVRKVASVAMLLLVVALLHRSVWVTLASATALLIALDYRKYARLILPVVSGLLLFGFISAVMVGDMRDTVTEGINQAITEPFEPDDNSTIAWRVTGWNILVKQALAQGPGTILFGTGFGGSFDRLMGGGTVTVSPHNAYVEIFLDSGLLGLGFYVAFFAQVALSLWQRRAEPAIGLIDPPMALALLSTLVVFGIPYRPNVDQALLFGCLGSYAAWGCRPRPAEPGLTVVPDHG